MGTSLAGGRYKIISQFGSGSMAYVFRASDNRLETDVIVKVPKPEKITTDDFRDRFRRESQLLVRLFHPHVVKVLDVGEHAELPYVVMQLLSGGTLSDRMKKNSNDLNQMSPESLQSWIREVARALDFCFKQGMVHRDVKPANILFDSDDNAYVGDFGLTKIMHGEHTELNSSGTASGVVLGTPNYLSPEIILGGAYDGRADQYSLGMTVYHAMCGRPPMQGKSATATMINQTQKKLELLSSFRSDIPRDLALAVQKSIEKSPANRFSSCEEFAEAVLDGLRTPSSSSQYPVDPAILNGTPSDHSSSSQSSSRSSVTKKRSPAAARSAATRAPANRSSAMRTAAAKKKQPSSASSSRLASTWLEAPPAAKLPPRKGKVRSASKVRSRQADNSAELDIFGVKVHPWAALAAGVVFCFSAVVYAAYYMTLGETDVAGSYESPVDNQAPAATPKNQQPRKKPAGEKKNQPTQGRVAEGEDDKTLSQSDTGPTRNSPIETRTAFAPANENDTRKPEIVGSLVSKTTVTESPASEPAADLTPHSNLESAFQTTDNPGTPFIVGNATESTTFGPAGCPVFVVGNKVWSVKMQTVVSTLQGEIKNDVPTVLSADGKFLAAASHSFGQQGTDVSVWDTDTGKTLFTAAGDNKRFVDTILLTSKSLLVGDRWSDEFLVWNCEDGKSRKPQKIADAKINSGNVAISNDSQYIAAVVQNQLAVCDSQSGKPLAVMTRYFGNSRSAAANAKAQAVYSSLKSLGFSADNQELAAISTLNGARLLCWNGRGELTIERPIRDNLSMFNNPLQWFPERKAWLVCNNIFDRGSERIVALAETGNHPVNTLGILDDNHLCASLSTAPEELQITEIPWAEIDASLEAMKNKATSLLHPDDSVKVSVIVGDSGAEAIEVREALQKSLKAKLLDNGLLIDEGSTTVFLLRVTNRAQDLSPIIASQIPTASRNREFAEPPSDPQLMLIAELLVQGNSEPIWRANLGNAVALMEARHQKDKALRKSAVDEFETRIETHAFPYFIPQDKELVALPVVIR